MAIANELIKKFDYLGIEAVIADYNKCGYHVEVFPKKDQVRDFAGVMLEMEFYLDFVTAVHVENALQAVYQFGHFIETCHVNAKAITEDQSIKTISDIFHGADWHEREAHDFYGLKFEDHPDLRVLILDEEDFDLKPLLKSDKNLKALDGITRKTESEDKIAEKPAKAEVKEE